jgi:hypothetical protein
VKLVILVVSLLPSPSQGNRHCVTVPGTSVPEPDTEQNTVHTEHINTLCGHFSPYLTGNTLRLRYRAQPVNAVWGNSRCLLWEPYGTLCGHFSPYLTGNTLRLRYRAQPVNAVWGNSRCLLWSWSSSCGRQSVNQFVWLSGLPLGSLTRFYLALLFRLTVTLFFVRRRSLWRENGSVVYSSVTQ